MADEEEVEGEEGVEEGQGKSGLKKIILMVVAFVLVAAISVFATLLLAGGDDSSDGDEQMPEGDELMLEDQVVSPDSGQAIYLALKPAFVVNYSQGSRSRYLQLEITVLGRDQLAIDAVSEHMPLIRNNLLETLNEQNYESLRSHEGKEQLAVALSETIQDVMLDIIGRPGIEKVLYRSFVMQ